MKITHSLPIQSQTIDSAHKKSKQSQQTVQHETYTKSTQEPSWNYSVTEVSATYSRNLLLPTDINKPDWSLIPTKGMQVPSQEELIAQIKALATKMANAPYHKDVDQLHAQFNRLHTQYLSPVSPDRKALHEQAMRVIKQYEAEKPTQTRELTLVDYLNEMDEIYTKNTTQLAGGTVSSSINSQGGYDYEVKVGGQTLMSSVNGHWLYGKTPAEEQKSKEFYQIYWSAMDQAKAELNGQ
ncbi:hypothetical protein ACFFHH_00415 [Cytobacillus solani]|uniref:Uncharacterized protein n=1 Tax=Cytobacillus solani TaxID=1637975 RepID=A0A0Q3VF51_9BACI|nr:hypothetical protein [Cytobacillus solani]KQL18202.1 hypothetical protein AN957_06095 [Cytobacillus solani]USK56043.1 hypothetical protein LIS82_05940 [Cytobacillus solani]